jgi:hypothetical protein
VSGDRNASGFDKTMNGFPWVAVPFGEERPAIEAAVPCTGYPTPGIVNAKTGQVIAPDVFEALSGPKEGVKAVISKWIASV